MLTFLAISPTLGWSQAGSGQPPAGSEMGGSVTQPVSEPDIPQTNEALPISDLNQPSIGSATPASPSYIHAGLHVSGGAESDPSGTLGSSPQFSSLTSALGSLDLLKLRHRSQTEIDYVGGATFLGSYGSPGAYVEQLHRLEADHRIVWRKAELTFADSFHYLRDGDFGSSSFGGASAYNLRFAGEGAGVSVNTGAADYFGASQMPLGQESFISNASVAEFTEALTRRSSIAFDVSYSIADYLGNSHNLFNDRQISTEARYNYQLNRRDSIGIVYGYQRFQFTQTGVATIVTNSAQLVYRHHILGRLDLMLGAGPELVRVIGSTGANGDQLNTTVQASLQYRFNRSNLSLSYNRLETGGFGVFAGGNSNIVRFSIERAISRSWRASFDCGYARASSIEASSSGMRASSYDYGFAGGAVQRQLGPRFDAFASYQFNHENSFCGPSAACTAGIQQHIALIGFDWNIRPIRLD
jgi:hypothetical protein